MLSYLQNLLGNKQTQQNQEYGSNLALQQSALGQQGQEYNANLAQQGQEFNSGLALQQQQQNEANQLAQQQFGLQQQGQQFGENMQSQDNVVPGSAQWASMAAFLQNLQNAGQKSQLTPAVVSAVKTSPNPVNFLY